MATDTFDHIIAFVGWGGFVVVPLWGYWDGSRWTGRLSAGFTDDKNEGRNLA